MRVPIPIVGPFYTNRSLPLSAQTTKNYYPEINSESREVSSLMPTPGLTSFAAVGGAFRGAHSMGGLLYEVSGTSLYSISSVGAVTSIGTIAGGDPVVMDDGNSQLIIAAGSKKYSYTTAAGLAEITDTDLGNANSVAFLNTHFIYQQSNGNFASSASGDGTNVDALDIAKAESDGDDLLRVLTNSQYLYLFGSETIETWYNSGVGNPPFDRVQGGVLDYGIAGTYAATKSNDFTYFLDHKRVPRRLSGISSQKISNPAISQEWSKYSDVSDARMFAFTLDGGEFIAFTFPSANKTWVFHEASGQWFEWATGSNRHRAEEAIYIYDKWLAFEWATGDVYEIDFDALDDNGTTIHRERVSAPISGELYGKPGAKLFQSRLELIMQAGEGLAVGQGSNPKVMLAWSDDGGRTWSNEIMGSIGKGGEYTTKVTFHRLGSFYSRMYRIRVTDPVKHSIIAANGDINIGTS